MIKYILMSQVSILPYSLVFVSSNATTLNCDAELNHVAISSCAIGKPKTLKALVGLGLLPTSKSHKVMSSKSSDEMRHKMS